jgi:hypothetical protein
MAVPDDQVGHPYDDLIAKLRAQGHTTFTREDIRIICEREGLWRGGPQIREPAVQLGIRSFHRWTEYLEDKTEHMLCLLRHFDGRRIRSIDLWSAAVYPELRRFLRGSLSGPGSYHLYLETHTSIAFTTGYILGGKSGAQVSVVQTTRAGKVVWHPAQAERREATSLWSFEEFGCNDQGPEVAVTVSITWEIRVDVRRYVGSSLPTVGRIIVARILPEPGPRAVLDGPHAMMLAEALVSHVRLRRLGAESEETVHLFIAAPNAFTFFLGQLAAGLGRCRLYEFEFDQGSPRDYWPSLTLPMPIGRREE